MISQGENVNTISKTFSKIFDRHFENFSKFLVSSLQYHYNLWNSVALEISKLDSFDLDRNIREIKNVKWQKIAKWYK